MNLINDVQQTVLNLLACELFGYGIHISKDTDWKQVYEECKNQAVVIHGLNAAKRCGVLSKDIEKQWQADAIAYGMYNYQNVFLHQKLHQMMKENSIPYVILKGCSSAYYYPNPLDRLMGDVDFLIDKSNLEKAGEILKQHGFAPWHENHICHIVYRKGRESLEMHFEPAGIPNGKHGQTVRKFFEDVMAGSQKVEYEGEKICLPSPFHHGLILLLHTSHHMLGEGIGLRHLCDWAVFANSLTEEKFCRLFEKRLKAIGIWKFACILSLVCYKYLHCQNLSWLEGKYDNDLIEQTMCDILKGGNFGQKEEGRAMESYLITDRGKDGVGQRSMIIQFVHVVNNLIRVKWPICKKLPVILPIGWIFFGIRYIYLAFRKERPWIRPKAMHRNAENRKSIYEQFNLFK